MNMGLTVAPRRGTRRSGPSRMKIEEKTTTRAPCLVIGAGHNGLSVAATLKREGIEPILLEQHAAVGDQWRERYERLHLHHITDAMHLPGVRFPEYFPRYLSRLDLAEYLESYARLHDLDVRLRHRVARLGRNAAGEWEAEVERPGSPEPLRFTADEVVLAVGTTGVTPRIPHLEGREEWAGEVVHSQHYRNAEGYEGKRVLVVGSGNSGVEICCDLYDHGAETSMLIRGPNSWATREGYAVYHRLLQFGGPILKYVPFSWVLAPIVLFLVDRYLKLDVRRRYGDLSGKGLRPIKTPPMLEVAMTRGAHPPTYVDGTWGKVGVSIFELIRDGRVKTFTSEISRLEPGTKTVVFADGQRAEFDVVLLCTGFEPILTHYASFLDTDVLETLSREGVFRILEPMKELPGLWISIGGLVSSRFAQVALGERIAARLQKRRVSGWVLSPLLSFFVAGSDPLLVRIPRVTILINLLAAAGLVAALS